jgi:hypothetical protein
MKLPNLQDENKNSKITFVLNTTGSIFFLIGFWNGWFFIPAAFFLICSGTSGYLGRKKP